MYSVVAKALLALVVVVVALVATLWMRSYWPDPVEPAIVQCSKDAPEWDTESRLKVMSYNVQYMASKNYVFFYDIDLEDEGRVAAVADANRSIASRPSEEHVYWTLDEVAEVIEREDPDVVLLQEVNSDSDSRTHYIDQVGELLGRVARDRYPCWSDTPYWKAEYIVHPQVNGPVDMRLLTLSKYRIEKSVRHQLPRKRRNQLLAPFYFQRALLESHIATDDGDTVAVINTHYDAWGNGSDVMNRQVAATKALLQSLDADDTAWILGGDLNLLPPDNNRQRRAIQAAGTGEYKENPPIQALYATYRGVPSITNLTSDDPQAWYTHFPNDPTVAGPDRTIDYLFYSDQWAAQDAYVLQDGTLQISDHLPVVGVYSLSPDDT